MPRAIEVDPYVIDVLMPDLVGHDRHPSAFVLYLHLWRQSDGGRRATDPASLAELAEETGLSKRAVQIALDRLRRRRLIRVLRAGKTDPRQIEILRPWRRPRA